MELDKHNVISEKTVSSVVVFQEQLMEYVEQQVVLPSMMLTIVEIALREVHLIFVDSV